MLSPLLRSRVKTPRPTSPAKTYRPFSPLRLEALESRETPSVSDVLSQAVAAPQPLAVQSVLFSDDFNRTNSATLGANWISTTGGIAVSNNASLSTGASNLSIVTGVVATDVAVQADVTVTSPGQSAGLVLRYTGPGDQNYYRADVLNYNGTNYARIYRNSGGSFVFLAQTPVSSGTGTLRFEASGSSLKLFLNGTLVANANDSALTTGGVGVSDTGANVGVDNFSVSNLNPTTTQTLPFTDTFDTSVNNQLSTDNWTNQRGVVEVRNGVAAGTMATSTNLPAIATVNGVNEPNVSVQADVNVSELGQATGLLARYDATTNSYYYADLVNYQGTAYARLYRVTAGTNTYLSQTQVDAKSGTLRFEASGSSLKLFLNGNVVATANDSVLTTGTVGISSYVAGSFDNFTAARLGTTQTLPFSDNFSNAVNGQISSTSYITQVGQVTVNQAGQVVGNTGLGLVTVNGVNVADSSISADVSVAQSGQSAGLIARYTGSGNGSYYQADLFNYNGTAYARIYRSQNGSLTYLNQVAVGSTSGTLRFDVQGTSLKLYLNNTLVVSANDSTLTTGSVGFEATGAATIDNFAVSQINATVQTLPFSDDFTTAVNQQLSASYVSQLGNFQVTNGSVAATTASALSTLSGVNTANVAVQADVSVPSNGQSAALVARYSGPGDQNYYQADLLNFNGTNYVRLYRNQGGNLTYLGQTQVNAGSGTLRLEAVGSSLRVFFNGTLAVSATDSVLTSGSVGLRGTTGATFDNFSASTVTVTAQTLPFSDQFDTAVNQQLSSTTWATQQGNFQVVGGVASGTGTFTSIATVNGVAAANVSVQANVTVSSPGQTAGVVLRYSDNSNYYYADLINYQGTTYARIFRVQNGVQNQLTQTVVGANNGALKFDAVGSTLTLSLNGNVIGSFTDSSLASGTVGISSTAGGQLDLFSAT